MDLSQPVLPTYPYPFSVITGWNQNHHLSSGCSTTSCWESQGRRSGAKASRWTSWQGRWARQRPSSWVPDQIILENKRCHLAKLRGVLDPKREPTIPFSTKLGPVPVRVPTLIGSPWSHCFLKLLLEMKIEIGPLSLCWKWNKIEHEPLQCWQHRQQRGKEALGFSSHSP